MLPADLNLQPKQPESFELLKKHLFEWSELSLRSCAAVGHVLTKTGSVCTGYRMTKCVNMRRWHVCDQCYWWRKRTKPFFFNPSVYQKEIDETERSVTFIHFHTFHTFSTQPVSSGAQWAAPLQQLQRVKATWLTMCCCDSHIKPR